MFSIRQATLNDVLQLKELFRNVILSVNRKDYTLDEVEDWASCGENDNRWIELVTNLYFIVVVDENNQITGYSSISTEGYLHSMFVHKDYQQQGIASMLYKEIERYAVEKGMSCITSEVSITARPFFEKLGFSVEAEQERKANKLYLINYKMSKGL